MLAEGKIPSDDLRVAFNSFVIKAEKFWPQLPNKEPTSWMSVIDDHKDPILAILPDKMDEGYETGYTHTCLELSLVLSRTKRKDPSLTQR